MNWLLLKNSLLVSGLAAVGAVGFGFFAALWAAGLSRRTRGVFVALAVAAVAMPPFLVTNCWLDLLGQEGVWRRWLPLNIYSLAGTAWILALLLWPIPMLAVLSAWRRLESAHLESEPALRGLALARWLLVPLARNELAVAAVLTFVLALNNFAVPAILQTKVFTAEVWVRFSTNFDAAGALATSWPLLAAPLLLLGWLRRRDVSWPSQAGRVGSETFRRQLGPAWWWSAGVLSLIVAALSVGLPVAELTLNRRTWVELPGALAAGLSACVNSVSFAALTGLLVVGAGVLSWRWRGTRWLTALLWVPFLVPGVLLGIGLIAVFNRPALGWLYQTTAIVIVAFTVRYLALGWTWTTQALRAVDGDLLDAARLDGASGWTLFRHVGWPLAGPQLAAAAYLTYLLCLWDVETLVLIVPPGGETLALRVFNLLHYGHNAQVNALCLTLLALALAPLGLWKLAAAVRSKVSHRSAALPPNGGTRSTTLGGRAPEDTAALPRWARGKPAIQPTESPHDLEPPRWARAAARLEALSKYRFWRSRRRREVETFESPTLSASSPRWLRILKPLLGTAGARAVSFGVVAWLLAGCSPPHASDQAALPSRFFSRAEIIGTRGTGLGQFNKPRSVAVDAQDNLYGVDMTGRVQKFSPDGVFLLHWQMPETELGKPKGMGRDRDGNLIVIEPHYARVNHFSPEGRLVRQWGAAGVGRGQFTLPRAVAVNSAGQLFVSEYSRTDRVQQFSPDGQTCLRVIGRPGTGPGEFNRPEGLGIDAQDRLYVADSCNHRIQVFSPDGQFLRAYGRAGSGPGELSYPYDVQVDAAGRQYVCEFGNSRIQVFDADGRSLEIIGGPGAAPGRFNNPWAIALDSRGNLYVADSQNHRVQKLVRRMEPTGPGGFNASPRSNE